MDTKNGHICGKGAPFKRAPQTLGGQFPQTSLLEPPLVGILLSISQHIWRKYVAVWGYANNSGRNLDLNKIRFSYLHYILQYNFGLDLNLKNLDHFTGIWKKLKETV